MKKSRYFIPHSSFLLVVFCHPKKIHLDLIILQNFRKNCSGSRSLGAWLIIENQKKPHKTKKPTQKMLARIDCRWGKEIRTWHMRLELDLSGCKWNYKKEAELSGVGWIRIFKYGICWISTWLGRWAWNSMRRQVWVKTACENLGTKTKQLYWNVIGLIEKKSMRKFMNIFLPLLLGNTGQNALLSEKTESYYGQLLFISRSKIHVFL